MILLSSNPFNHRLPPDLNRPCGTTNRDEFNRLITRWLLCRIVRSTCEVLSLLCRTIQYQMRGQIGWNGCSGNCRLAVSTRSPVS